MTTVTLTLDNTLANFNHLVYCPETRDCLVIDPLDVDGILRTAAEQGLMITQIVNTHEHRDHTDGNLAIKAKTNATVLAHHGAADLIPGFDQGLHAGDCVQVGTAIALTVLDTPGHTFHSICLFDEHGPAIYTGDTLFHYGCGNCHNGGDPEVMFRTFETIMQHLPNDTLIYPGHDYIRKNLAFAQSFQPELSSIQACQRNLIDNGVYTSTLGEDKTINPFFRLDERGLHDAIRTRMALSDTPTRKEVFLALRALRDRW